jgi:membrane protein YdbS with pleckstrin-like domain
LAAEENLVQEYLSVQKNYKLRRLAGVGSICVVLFILFAIIWANGWFDVVGNAGMGWVAAGIFTAVAAIGAVVLDLFWRKEA